MIKEFFIRLMNRRPSATKPAQSVEYQGFIIIPTPRQTDSGWLTSGTITKMIDNQLHTKKFIRADMLMTYDDAVEFSILKAHKIINEQGDQLFSNAVAIPRPVVRKHPEQ